METLTRLVSESMARHGFDRPVDYRRLQWSRWFRCESHHSLLFVPSKPGVFALAEEILSTDIATTHVGTDPLARPASPSEAKASVGIPTHVGTAASAVPRSGASAPVTKSDPEYALSATVEEPRFNEMGERRSTKNEERCFGKLEERPLSTVEERCFSAASRPREKGALAPVEPRRMLAVSQFFEDDDMAFVLDRMLSHENPMRNRLTSGRYLVRYVVIEDASQRHSICNALNQWIASSSEKATGIGSHFASSMEYVSGAESTRVGTDPLVRPASLSEAKASGPVSKPDRENARPTAQLVGLVSPNVEERRFSSVEEGRFSNAQEGRFSNVEERRFSAASETRENGALAPVAARGAKTADGISNPKQTDERKVNSAPTLNSAVATNIHCSSSFPSGF